MRSLVFGIHNPSRRTAATLHRALHAYTNAASAVLEGAKHDWNALLVEGTQNGTLTSLNLSKALARRYHAHIMPYPLHSSLRDALFADLAATLCSYHTLCTDWEAKRERVRARIAAEGWTLRPLDPRAAVLLEALGRPPSWPTAPQTRPRYDLYEQELERLTTTVPNEDAAAEHEPLAPRSSLVDLLHVRTDPQGAAVHPRPPHLAAFLTTRTRPLFFSRPDGAVHTRNFSLLRSEKDGRYYALLYVLPANDPRARPLAVPPPEGKRGALVAVHPSGAVVRRTAQASCALCLPLECGEWHEKTALEEATCRPEMVRVARLYHRPPRRPIGGQKPARFVLAITFEHVVPERRAVQAHMGVSLDEHSRAAWVVQDAVTGKRFAQGVDETLCGLQERWRQDRREQTRAGRMPPRAHHVQAEQVKHAAHAFCNRLVALASAHGAQVAVTDVRYLRERRPMLPRDEGGKRAPRSAAWHAAVAEQQYRHATLIGPYIERILTYKLPRAGLPRPLSVGGISPRDCATCGGRGIERDRCGLCGALLGVENTAAVTATRVPEVLERIRASRAKRAEQSTNRTPAMELEV
jgi:hypothetical protein